MFTDDTKLGGSIVVVEGRKSLLGDLEIRPQVVDDRFTSNSKAVFLLWEV